MKTLSLAICAALAALSTPAFANKADDATTLDTITTAARRVQPVDLALASVTVLERADIEALQIQDALSLLRHVAGLDIARTGGTGSSTSVFMRGSNSNHVLVLIDGVRAASNNTGSYAFEGLDVELIERVEIVRGPRAAQWGSDAIGGVIHITTRKPNAAQIGLRAGNRSSFGWVATAGLGDAETGLGIALTRNGTDGISSQNSNGFSFNADKDANYRDKALFNARSQMNDRARVDLSMSRSRNDVEFDQGRSLLVQRHTALRFDIESTESYRQQLHIGYVSDDLATPAFGSRFTSERLQGDWLHHAKLTASDLSFGINAAEDSGSEAVEKRTLIAPFISWAKSGEQLDFEFSARFDDDSSFGSRATYGAALGYRFDNARIFANTGTAFRAPSFNELYSPGFDGLFAGNANLNPERSRSHELGLDLNVASSKLTLRAFDSRISELISFTGGQIFQAENIARARIRGAEVTLATPFEIANTNCTSELRAEVQNPRNEGDDSTLLRRAKRKGYARFDCALGDVRINATGFGYGQRKDFGAVLPGYGLMDLGLDWTLSPQWKLAFKVENALDKNYEQARGFNALDRSLWLRVDWQPSLGR
jgi:vitamin B12 transporter